jgi:dTDP-4-dehydrorhamnose reductase
VRILIVGSDTSLGEAMLDYFLLKRRHSIKTLLQDECRWKSERQAKKAVSRASCDLVIDARIVAATETGEVLFDIDISRTLWLAKASHRGGLGYLYLSSTRVFSGTAGRLYTEDDYPDSEDTLGELLLRGETAIRDSCERHLILRIGPVISNHPTSFFSRRLAQIVHGGKLALNNNVRGAPVLAEDAARVVSALADQLSTNADVWGIYHYCGSEMTNAYEFAELVLASATQFTGSTSGLVELEKHVEPGEQLNRSLDCTKIRNTFAVKQEPWRGAIAGFVTHYFQNQ